MSYRNGYGITQTFQFFLLKKTVRIEFQKKKNNDLILRANRLRSDCWWSDNSGSNNASSRHCHAMKQINEASSTNTWDINMAQ